MFSAGGVRGWGPQAIDHKVGLPNHRVLDKGSGSAFETKWCLSRGYCEVQAACSKCYLAPFLQRTNKLFGYAMDAGENIA